MLARVSVIDAVTWAPLPFDDDADLVALAARCLAADGGLPLAADPAFLRRRWTTPGTLNLQARTGDGLLIAAGALRPGTAGSGATFVGLVDPAGRGRGLGAHLLDWGLDEAARVDGPVTVETESLTAESEALFAARGLRQVFAEDVMRIDLTRAVPDQAVPDQVVPGQAVPDQVVPDQAVPDGGWPDGTALAVWSAETAPRFHRVYEAAFRERPGFPGWSAEQWIADTADDDEFRPDWSVLAAVPGLGDAGFVTAAIGWIVQVGVIPSARGRGIGAALVTEALRRMRADGATQAWLDVNIDNPAVRLYRKLGFEHRGRRARYRF
jgi:ribosomal protein S18 acetylase RimI-like enzyme